MGHCYSNSLQVWLLNSLAGRGECTGLYWYLRDIWKKGRDYHVRGDILDWGGIFITIYFSQLLRLKIKQDLHCLNQILRTLLHIEPT